MFSIPYNSQRTFHAHEFAGSFPVTDTLTWASTDESIIQFVSASADTQSAVFQSVGAPGAAAAIKVTAHSNGFSKTFDCSVAYPPVSDITLDEDPA